jgi:predicted  nucleic acid-binding Zn-ribbon protein
MSSVNSGQTLLRLVEVDKLLMQLRNQLNTLPQRPKLEELAKNQEHLTERFDQIGKLKLRQEMSIRALRDEQSMISEKITASQKQIDENSAKYKEVALLATEIDSLNKRLEKIVFEIGELNSGVAKIKEVEDQLDERLLLLTESQNKLTEALEQNTDKLNEQVSKLGEQRARLAQGLPKQLVERYDKLREIKQGIGASALNGRICSACFMELTEGQLAKARLEIDESGIGICPSCHRLMVV